jgi:ribonuclease Y
MPPLPLVLAVALALVVGGGIGYYLRYLHAIGKKRSLELTLKEQTLKAEEKAIAIVERAEAKAEKLAEEAKAERKERELELKHERDRLEKREELLDTRQIDLDSQTENVRNKIDEVKALKHKLDERAEALEARLHEVAGMDRETAYQHIIKTVQQKREGDIVTRLQKLELLGEEQFTEQAKNLLLAAIHRVGNSLPTNIMTAAIEIPSDDIKGKIIGKEGRNVRAFERITGVEVLVDDTPGYIVLSSFDPIRREIARVALEALIKDGRIQPAKIEEVVEKARSDVAKTIKKMGEQATFEANVHGLHPELVTILGRLYFRTSYGQNVLAHSVEMAHIAGMLATEIGADPAIARAGALVHDIGKVASHEIEGTHVEIGIRLLKKYDVDERIILAMRAHHEEYPYETPESIIVQVADAISGARPGARRDSVENYIKRLTELEAIASNLRGVEKAFAIAAGREIRVMVNPESLNELETHELARTIATDIQNQLRYPGEIKVHVIRETRVISYAR